MQSPRAHGHAGRPVGIGPRLEGVAMEYEALNAFAKGPITEVLDEGRMSLPFFAVRRRERFRPQNWLSINMSRRRHLRAAEGGPELAPRPEFRHWLVGLSRISHVFGRFALVGFDREPNAVSIGQFTEMAGIILQQQFIDSHPHIPEKPFRNFQAVHHMAGHYRQQVKWVVASQALEFLAKLWRPVLRSNLPTVDMSPNQRFAFARQGRRIADHFRHQPGEGRLGTFLAQFIAFQAEAAYRSRMVFHACAGVAEPQDGPLAGRHIPAESAIALHLRAKVNNSVAGHHGFGRHRWVIHAQRDFLARIRRLAAELLDDVFIRRPGKGKQHDVAIETFVGFRLGENRVQALRTRDIDLAPDDMLHGKLRRDPRPPAAAPARVIIHIDFDAKTMRLLADMLEEGAPGRTAEARRAALRTLLGFHVKHSADADPFHRLEIGGDAIRSEEHTSELQSLTNL